MTRRAAIYLRISLDRTGEEAAVERQLEDCQAIIAQRGWTQAGDPYVDNSVSASKRDVVRPEYERLVADFQRGLFDALVCYDLDRLTRQPRQLEDWIDAAEERDLVLVTANGEADLSTDGGRMFARVKAAVARSEIERKGARHRRANEQRRAQGRPLPGRRRYGYEPDGMTPREEEAAVVRRCFDAIASGASVRGLVLDLIRDEVPPGTGKGWGTVRVRNMLLNPSYAGLLHSQGQALPSEHITPIVSPELAEEVRAILTDEKRRTTTGPGRRYLASGLVACGVDDCDRTLFVHSGYYTCKTFSNSRSAEHVAPRVPHVGIKAEKLDRILREHMALALLTTPPETLAGGEAPEAAPLVARLDRIARSVDAIIADRDDDLITPQAARSRLLALRDERREVEAALDAARASRTASTALAELAQAVVGEAVPRFPGLDFWPLRDAVVRRIEGMDLDRQRDALQQLLVAQVQPGRARDRVKVWHLIAEHLNPELLPV